MAWPTKKLGELTDICRGSSPRPICDTKYFEGGTVPWVKIADATKSGKFLYETKEHVNDYGASFSRRLPPGTILVAASGTLGYTQILGVEGCAHDGWLILQNLRDLDRDFAYYALKTLEQHFFNSGSGAAIQNINTDILRQAEIPHPPVPVQRRIAGILSAYDELMENSQRRIRLLEAMARALYRECIREDGDSTSVKGILETDYWTFISANVSPYGGTKRYYATADIEGLAVQGAGIDYTFAEKPSRAQKQPTPFSLWFARMKDTYKIAWYSEVNAQSADSTILSSGFAGFQAVEPLYFPLLFLTVSSKEFHAQKDLYCTGATQMSLTNEGLSIIEVPAPTKRAARRLGERTLPLLNQILVLQLRIQNLRRTRDLLLPRLLSGQVSLAVNGT